MLALALQLNYYDFSILFGKMILSISLVAIVILLILIVVFFLSENFKKDALNILFNLLLVVLGFSLAMLWDNVKSEREEKKEAESIVVLLRLETGSIHGAIENNIKMLNININAKDIASIPPPSLCRLKSSTWESAKLRNNIFIKNTGDLIQLENLYTLVTIVNEQIVFRENFINTNFNTKSYLENIKRIDSWLLRTIYQTKKINEIVQDYLYAIPPEKIEGYSFEISNDKVENTSKK